MVSSGYKDLMPCIEMNLSQARGEEKVASVLFVDIADYTEFAERTNDFNALRVLSLYFRIAGHIVKAHGGRIIDYYGDGFLAIFGLSGSKDHALDLINAAFVFQDAIKKFDEYMRFLTHSDFRIRLGAHTGKLVWGTIGIEGMQKKTAIGDTVNFASRIEQANKELNTEFLVSESLYKQLNQEIVGSKSYNITVKGKSGQHQVYALDKS